MQTEEYKDTLRNPNTAEYRKYRNKVSLLTKKTYVQYSNIINPDNLPRTLAGVTGGYHLDHIISCREGFGMGHTPEYISSISNLQMLPWRDNITKGRK